MAVTQIEKDVEVVFYHVTEWEEANNEFLFLGFYDSEDHVFMLSRIGKALKHGTPPDRITVPEDFALFILNEMIEYAADTGVNNIKAIIKAQDRNAIADECALTYATAEASWPTSIIAFRRLNLNNILGEPD